MSYRVTVIAPDAQWETARKRFCEVLETGPGGPNQVAPCFHAWAKHEEHGLASLREPEDKAAGAWIRSHHAAQVAARATLCSQSGADLLIRPLPS